MSSSISSYALLYNLANKKTQQPVTVSLIFSGFESDSKERLVARLNEDGLTLRSVTIDSESTLLRALSEDQWDSIICRDSKLSSISADQIVTIIENQGHDLPVLRLAENTESSAKLSAYRSHITQLIDQNSEQLFVAELKRELAHLAARRKLHKLEQAAEQSKRLSRELLESAEQAIALIQDREILNTNPKFNALFALTASDPLPSLENLIARESLGDLNRLLSQEDAPNTTKVRLNVGQGRSVEAEIALSKVAWPDHPELYLRISPLESAIVKETADSSLATDHREKVAKVLKEVQNRINSAVDTYLFYVTLADAQSNSREALGTEQIRTIQHTLESSANSSIYAQIDAQGFIAVIPALNDTEAMTLAKALENAVGRLELPQTVSIGIASTVSNDVDAANLIKQARAAAFDARQAITKIKLYKTLEKNHEETSTASHLLENAIRGKKLKLLYQPLVHLNEKSETQHFEILVRMIDENQNELIPGQFMHSLEHASIMVRLDRWVIENALIRFKSESHRSKDNQIFINLARRTLRNDKFTAWLEQQLSELNIPAELLIFSLSESDVAAEMELAKAFSKTIRDIGCAICLKHFGSSSYSQDLCDQIQPRFVKLDGSLIDALDMPSASRSAITNLIQPLRTKQIQVIAPLIEEIGQLGELYKLGIDMVQGYYLQPPRPTMVYEYFENEP